MVLVVEQLNKSYHLRPVLKSVSFSVGDGETVGVFGRNGAGKTTLLRVISRICSCDGGDVKLSGRSLMGGSASPRSALMYLGHQPNLYPVLSAEENLRLVSRLYDHVPSGELILNALNRVGLIHQRWDPIRTYSRGMLQRLGLAKTMLVPWKILLLDEPATGLDRKGVEILESFIKRWQEERRSMIIVSHDRWWLDKFCARILELQDGTVLES